MRAAISRFSAEMERHLTAHGEQWKDEPYTECSVNDLLETLMHQTAKLRVSVGTRGRSRTPEELREATDEVRKHAVHVANYAMFIHDNLSLGRAEPKGEVVEDAKTE